ncbi:MAG TPA: GTPase ObgE [Candidatus Moranbacteria bacterium]|nr:GTPase ObgE [Candidatus Moranbacteria bacterium]
MLTDEAKIKIMAGKGGDGIVTFDKIKMSLGPTGGRGGNGGNVYFEGVSNLAALNKYRHKKEHWAQDGQKGKSDRKDGYNGKDIILAVPIGTLAHNLETGKKIDITKVGQRVLAAKGGIGGRGNFYFRSSTNTTPKEFEKGKSGEAFNFVLELRLIADIGLIGLPNAGKSSLLNELTKADVRVAGYPFTTLEPNLGTLENIIIADIPGLIEGASLGKGLGIKFLRHIQRTKILAHCISLEASDLKKDYETIRRELEEYSAELGKKKEIIILTKSDTINPKEIVKKEKEMKKINRDIFISSIHDWESLEKIKSIFIKLTEK